MKQCLASCGKKPLSPTESGNPGFQFLVLSSDWTLGCAISLSWGVICCTLREESQGLSVSVPLGLGSQGDGRC